MINRGRASAWSLINHTNQPYSNQPYVRLTDDELELSRAPWVKADEWDRAVMELREHRVTDHYGTARCPGRGPSGWQVIGLSLAVWLLFWTLAMIGLTFGP